MDIAKVFDEKKFMWDGGSYHTREEGEKRCAKYELDNFEVKIWEEGGEYFVFTRRTIGGDTSSMV